MNLYKISQTVNDDYDTYDSAIVAAESEAIAANLNPGDGSFMHDSDDWDQCNSSWCKSPDEVIVTLVGTAKPGTPQGLILSSFNAG